MIKYIIYTQKNCVYCAEAKSLLDDMEEVYAPNGEYNKEYNYWEDDYGQRIFKVDFISSITDEELKVLKKFNMVYDIWQDLHSPEKYNYKENKNDEEQNKTKSS